MPILPGIEQATYLQKPRVLNAGLLYLPSCAGGLIFDILNMY
jgi:hypothetical protein